MCNFCENIYPDEDIDDIVFGRGKYSNIRFGDNPFITIDEEGHYDINVNPGDPYELGVIVDIKYCPYCGRDLADKTIEASEKVIKMRDATPEERKSIENYIKDISKPTGVNFGTLIQESKTGSWILIDKELSRYKCSECGEIIRLNKKNEITSLEKNETLNDYPYSHCGARMVESQEQESED